MINYIEKKECSLLVYEAHVNNKSYYMLPYFIIKTHSSTRIAEMVYKNYIIKIKVNIIIGNLGSDKIKDRLIGTFNFLLYRNRKRLYISF